ncbi:outer membrane protein [Pistricoccus aurantiacus]|uniref:outer membrane protein n=1 Tax=Pistricoccus aurantiacus TaxID=1883414 RepID=UPI00362FD2E4
MKKLTILASSLILAGFSATALAASPQPYIGGQVGYQSVSAEVNQGSTTSAAYADQDLSGIQGGLFAGMKFTLANDFFIAPEINVGTSNADGKLRTDNVNVKAEAKESYGAGLLAGLEATRNTDVYARVGYQRTKFEVRQSVDGAGSRTEDDNYNGFRYGVGVQTAIAPQMDLRLDWSQTSYSDNSYKESGSKVKFDPTENLVQLGIAYNF